MRKTWCSLLAAAILAALCSFSTLRDQSIEVLCRRGEALEKAGMVDSALTYYNKALALYQPGKAGSKEIDYVARTHLKIATLQSNLHANFASAFRHLQAARQVARQHGLTFCCAVAETNLGVMYSYYDDTSNALYHLRLGLESALECEKYDRVFSAFRNLVVQTLPEGGKRNHETDSTLRTVMDAHGAELSSHATEGSQKLLLALAKAWLAKDMVKALDCATAWKENCKGNDYDAKCVVAELCLLTGRTRRAVNELAEVWQAREPVSQPIHMYAARRLIDIYSRAGRADSAMLWYWRSRQLDDSLFQRQPYALLRDMRSDFEQQQADQRVASEQQRRSQTLAWLWVAVAFVAVLAAASVLLYRANRNMARRNSALFQKETERLRRSQPKPKGPNGGTEADPALLQQINQVMSDAGLITQPDFTIATLAHECGVSVNRVSDAIHKSQGCNFNIFLANARIDIASRQLRDPSLSHLTIEAVANELGFQSRSNFAIHFRRVTGLNPAEYRRMAMEQ